MFCTNCGKEIESGSVFCLHCGARQEQAPAPSDPISAPEDLLENVVGTEERECSPERIPDTAEEETIPEAAPSSVCNSDTASGPDTTPQPETNETPQNEGAPDTSDTDEDCMRKIVCKNTGYYLKEFAEIRRGGCNKLNWASFFFSLAHASYRNVWREWLKAMRIPLLAIIPLALTTIFGLAASNDSVLLCAMLLGAVDSIWFIACQILFAKRFNRIYLAHVEKKLCHDNLFPDPSAGRVLCTLLAYWGICIAASLILFITVLIPLAMEEYPEEFPNATEEYSADLPPDSVPEPSAAAQSALDSFLGDWVVERYSGDSPELVNFSIQSANGRYYFSATANWKVQIPSTLIEAAPSDTTATQASGEYTDNRGNTGKITLNLSSTQPDVLYLTITVDNSADRGLALAYEYCIRPDAVRTEPASAPAKTQKNAASTPSRPAYESLSSYEQWEAATFQTFSGYIYGLTEAINYQDFSLVSHVFVKGSQIYQDQKALVSSLSEQGITEEVLAYDTIDQTLNGDTAVLISDELIGVTYADGTYKEVHQSYAYYMRIQDSDIWLMYDMKEQ
ncbi:zinc ribbon domain-containing protein [Agathobaculum sp.]|uniref:zinc ribbon domain-containing protein n=1 Tax=Agathobaculum sp. TaxID=2048138 RepID=UPI002A819D63|nr:zinc ribbon domain-containing protein [Agathobaculum sp.]MDY3617783.1 zinc ribbon domain-containing protein [Agathobaculum sp.]